MTDLLFETSNLTARRFTPGDNTFIFELLNMPAWKQFIGDRNINTLDDATNYLHTAPLAIYRQHNYGPWLIAFKTTGQPIGMCGLFKRDYLDQPDLGFAFLSAFEGKGYAYESSIAALAYVKANYTIPHLYATTTDTNMRSQTLLERCRFVNTGMVNAPGVGELRLYKRTL